MQSLPSNIRDSERNLAISVRAVATLEEMAGAIGSQRPGRLQRAGVVIVIGEPPVAAQTETIDLTAHRTSD